MSRPSSPILTEGELRIMNILWEHGSASVKEVTEVLSKTDQLAYTTVLSTLQTLTKKGVVKPEKKGRAHFYSPMLKQQDARKNAVSYIMSRFFGGSADSLLLNVFENEEINADTLSRLKSLVDEQGNDDGDTDS